MERTNIEGIPPPPRIINSLKAGFDAIATHVSAILLPFLLNLFFWLGPRLRLETLFNALKADAVSAWQTIGIPSADIQTMLGLYEKIIPNFNLFWTLRTFPIGIFGLKALPLSLVGMLTQKVEGATPLGLPLELQATGLDLLLWYLLLTFVGWLGGGLYFYLVAKATFANSTDTQVSLLRALFQTILLSIVWNFLSIVIGIPVRLILGGILQVTGDFGTLVILLLSFFAMWVVVPFFFWPHGIFVKNQNFLVAAWSSLQMTRFTLPTSSLFVLSVLMLSFGLSYLWNVPPENSWMTLFGIFGHAFVTTGLLSASFIYYRDMSAWLQKVLEQVRSAAPRPTV